LISSSFQILGGHQLCYKALQFLLGVSTNLLVSVAGTPKAPAPPAARRRPRLGGLSNQMNLEECKNSQFTVMLTRTGFNCGNSLYNKSDCVENWLHGLIDQFCDIQPDKGKPQQPKYQTSK
jgi:hypothetical protein